MNHYSGAIRLKHIQKIKEYDISRYHSISPADSWKPTIKTLNTMYNTPKCQTVFCKSLHPVSKVNIGSRDQNIENVTFNHRVWRMNEKSTDSMHGITLKIMLEELVTYYGWGEMGIHVKVRCFNMNPSIKSSLAFLRKTPWARNKVEYLYKDMLDEKNGVETPPKKSSSPWPNVD